MGASAPARPGPFRVKDCALIAIATGERALTVKELHDVVARASAQSVYFHFWGGLLEPRFEEREYNNDFAAWARHALHDPVLAERLSVLDPSRCGTPDALREEVVERLEERLDESELLPWIRATRPFELLRAQIVVFDTHAYARTAAELAALVPGMSTGSVFYHFIDARRRCAGGHDDFRAWLAGFDGAHARLCERLAAVDPYFSSLTQLRDTLAALLDEHTGGSAP